MNPQAICILGAHRSGTSTVTRSFNLCGVYLGPEEELLPAAPDNPEGYWERVDIISFHDRLLLSLNRRYETVLPLPMGWLNSPEIEPFRDELRQIIRTTFSGCSLWGWKDPRTCLFLDLWKEVLKESLIDLKIVYVVRNPIDVAKSFHKREGFSLEKGLGIWFNFNASALLSLDGMKVSFISYDNLLEIGASEVYRCFDELKVLYKNDNSEEVENVNIFLRHDLRHSISDIYQLDFAPYYVKELYLIICDAMSNISFNIDMIPVNCIDIYKKYCSYSTIFSEDIQLSYKLSNDVIIFANEINNLTNENNNLTNENIRLNDIIVNIINTRSWRLTVPLRIIAEFFCGKK